MFANPRPRLLNDQHCCWCGNETRVYCWWSGSAVMRDTAASAAVAVKVAGSSWHNTQVLLIGMTVFTSTYQLMLLGPPVWWPRRRTTCWVLMLSRVAPVLGQCYLSTALDTINHTQHVNYVVCGLYTPVWRSG